MLPTTHTTPYNSTKQRFRAHEFKLIQLTHLLPFGQISGIPKFPQALQKLKGAQCTFEITLKLSSYSNTTGKFMIYAHGICYSKFIKINIKRCLHIVLSMHSPKTVHLYLSVLYYIFLLHAYKVINGKLPPNSFIPDK